MVDSIVFKIALIGLLGIGAQWTAWRFRLPSVVLLAAAGILVGPVTGLLDPAVDFGHLFRPLVSVAVAVILFEGGLTLNLRELRHSGVAVRRMVVIGAPLGWALGTAAAHYIAGLSWEASAVFGGILVVTGPTVIIPLLRAARLKPNVGSVLRWEGIINDPIGAMFAVVAYEVVAATAHAESAGQLLVQMALGGIAVVALGVALGFAVVQIFRRGWVPEFLKSPLLIAAVLIGYAAANFLVEEAGLLSVTAMGLVIGNSRLVSLEEIRRFKEYMTVVLVSGVFILLTATITIDTVRALDWRAFAFLGALLFLVRPAAVMLSTFGSGLALKERIFVAWIAPRGVVAVAVTGLFGTALVDLGFMDGNQMVALAFLVVFATIILHGFSLRWLARRFDLISAVSPGVLIVGASPWAISLAKKLKELDIPVMIADPSWNRLRRARMQGIDSFLGDILSESAEHGIDFNQFEYIFAATDDDAYNSLVLATFGPTIGCGHVVVLSTFHDKEDYAPGLRGESVLAGFDFWDVVDRTKDGWSFVAPRITEEAGLDQITETRGGDFTPLLLRRENGRIGFSPVAKRRRESPAISSLASANRCQRQRRESALRGRISLPPPLRHRDLPGRLASDRSRSGPLDRRNQRYPVRHSRHDAIAPCRGVDRHRLF